MSLDVTSLDWPFIFFRRFSAPKCRQKNRFDIKKNQDADLSETQYTHDLAIFLTIILVVVPSIYP